MSIKKYTFINTLNQLEELIINLDNNKIFIGIFPFYSEFPIINKQQSVKCKCTQNKVPCSGIIVVKNVFTNEDYSIKIKNKELFVYNKGILLKGPFIDKNIIATKLNNEKYSILNNIDNTDNIDNVDFDVNTNNKYRLSKFITINIFLDKNEISLYDYKNNSSTYEKIIEIISIGNNTKYITDNNNELLLVNGNNNNKRSTWNNIYIDRC
jgi:hypothetical protein